MKKKKKAKPRTQINIKEKVFNYYKKEMEETTEKFIQINQNAFHTKFNLFQSTDKNKIIDRIFELALFYDQNFVGNKDFMHIPTIKQITQNIAQYPIMLVTNQNEFGEEEIVGVTTIKMEKNDSISKNPYFPTKNETVLFITGILTKQLITDSFGNKIKGIGKQLFKSAIKSAYELNKQEKVRLVCEVDCRNQNSLKSISNAVRELQEEGIGVNLSVTGYYEIINNQNNLVEAPTFLLEIDLNGKENFVEDAFTIFSYPHSEATELFSNLKQTIKNNTEELKLYKNFKKENTVIYHSIKKINALKVQLNVGDTALGNDRIPITQALQLELVHA